MLEKAMMKYEIEDIVRYIYFDTISNEEIYISAKENIVLKRINYPGNCYTLDVTQMHDVVGKGSENWWWYSKTSRGCLLKFMFLERAWTAEEPSDQMLFTQKEL